MAEKVEIPKRVLFQYSVDFGEVPSRANFLTQDLALSLQAQAEKLKDTAGKLSTSAEGAIDGIKELLDSKTALEKSILRIDDIMKTMSSYLEILIAATEKKSSQEHSEPPAKKKTKKKKKKTKKKEEE